VTPVRDEDDLRAALRTLERYAPDQDKMLLALRSRSRSPRRKGSRPLVTGLPDRWRRWVTPLAAAAAVSSAIAGSILVSHSIMTASGHSKARHPVTWAPPFPTSHGVPGYVLMNGMVLQQAPGDSFSQGPSADGGWLNPKYIAPSLRDVEMLPIIDTATGRTLTRARMPGYVAMTTASDGAWFAAVEKGPLTTFYEIRLAGSRATLTALPIPPDTLPIAYLAVSPDGSRLAFATEPRHTKSQWVFGRTLVVASALTGTEHRWTAPVASPGWALGSLTWLRNGTTLAFNWIGPAVTSAGAGLRLLDTTAPGHDLLSARTLLLYRNQAGTFRDLTISQDGTAVFGIVGCLPGCPGSSTGVAGGQRDTVGSLVRFTAGTGASRLVYTEPELVRPPATYPNSACNDPMWVSPSGTTVLLACYREVPPAHGHLGAAGIWAHELVNGKVTRQLPWLARLALDEETAFPGHVGGGQPIPSTPQITDPPILHVGIDRLETFRSLSALRVPSR
jgi:hypothetical protein